MTLERISVQGRPNFTYHRRRTFYCADRRCAAPVAAAGETCPKHGCYFCARGVPHQHIERPAR